MLDIPENIKELLKNTECHKEIVISFPENEHEQITNENLISESLKLTESICSQDELEFGLCEASVLEFSAIGIGNIKGLKIVVNLIIENETIPYGAFVVEECQRTSGDIDVRNVKAFSESAYDDYYRAFDSFYEFMDVAGSTRDNYGLGYGTLKKLVFKNGFGEEKSLKETGSMLIKRKELFVNYKRHNIENMSEGRYYIQLSSIFYDVTSPYYYYIIKCDDLNTITGFKTWAKIDNEYKEIVVDLDQGTNILTPTKVMELFPNDVGVPNEDGGILYWINGIYTKYDGYIDIYSSDEPHYIIEMHGNITNDIGPGKMGYLRAVPFYDPFNVIHEIETLVGGNYVEEDFRDRDTGEIIDWKESTHMTASVPIMQGGMNYYPDAKAGYADTEELKNIQYDLNTNKNVYFALPTRRNYSPIDYSVNFIGKYYFIPVKIKNHNDDNYSYLYRGPYYTPSVVWMPTRIILHRIENGSQTIVKSWNIPDNYDLKYATTDFRFDTNSKGVTLQQNRKITRMRFEKDITNRYIQTKNQSDIAYTFSVPDNFRNDLESLIELDGNFGKVNRDGTFTEISLGTDMLYPSSGKYPSNDLYPGGNGNIGAELYTRRMYSKCLFDDYYKAPYGKVICNYTNEDGENAYAEYVIREPDYDLQYDEYLNYDLSNNAIIKNNQYSESDMRNILYNLGNAIENIQYMPIQMVAKGLPYVEAGDLIEIIANDEIVKTYMLRRTLTGIQQLKDTIISK